MREFHPYGEFVPPAARSIIIGSFPIGKFTDPLRRNEIKDSEIDFFFGGERNLLWKILSDVFKVKLDDRDSIIAFLTKKKIAIGDVIKSCKRRQGRAKDSDLYEIQWNIDLLQVIKKAGIKKAYFTSKKVESWFNSLFPESYFLEKITLISPSAQTLRSLVQRKDFVNWSLRNPEAPKLKFILEDYQKKFKSDI